MDDPLLVRGLERFRNLLRDGQHFVQRQSGSRPDLFRKIFAFDKLHHKGVHAGGFLEPVDRGDVGVIERRERLGFALEPGESFRIGGKRTRQDLDGHLPAQRRVGGPPDLPHAAFADLGRDVVDAETGAGG